MDLKSWSYRRSDNSRFWERELVDLVDLGTVKLG